MLGEKHNLPDVLRVMRKGAIQRLQDGVRLLADRNGAYDVLRPERIKRSKDYSPPLLPRAHHLAAGCGSRNLEFAVAEAIWLFTIAGEKVGEA